MSFAGKRVAVIGTGATGVQTIQEVAKTAGHLTVFQRTPNWCAPLHNGQIAEETQREIKAGYPEMFERCQETFACFLHTPDPRGTFEVTPEEREAFCEKLYAEPRLRHLAGQFPRHPDRPQGQRAGQRLRRPQDPPAGEGPGGGREADPEEPRLRHPPRAARDQLLRGLQPAERRLVDITETPIERITPNGIKTSDAEYEFDIIIYATGFDAITGSFDRIDIRGAGRPEAEGQVGGRAADLSRRAGRGLPQHVDADGPAHRAGQHPALHRIQRRMGDRPDPLHARARPDPRRCPARGVAAWTDHVKSLGEGLLSNEVDSWMTGINRNVEGKQTRIIARYSGSAPAYRARCDAVAANGYRELVLM